MISVRQSCSGILAAFLLLCSCTGCHTVSEDDTFTFCEAISEHSVNLNPHRLRSAEESRLAALCETGLVYRFPDTSDTDVWKFAMAKNIEDITEDFDDDSICESTGRVFRISLNQDAVWENGEKILAETYVYSMKALLDPEMNNMRRLDYTEGVAALRQAEAYHLSGLPIYVPAISDSKENAAWEDSTEVYFSLYSHQMRLTSRSVADILGDSNISESVYETLEAYADPQGFIAVCDDTEPYIRTLAEQVLLALGISHSESAYREMLFVRTEEYYPAVSFEEVGLYATDEYTLIYITESVCEIDVFLQCMTQNWIVYEPYYEAGKRLSYNCTVTDYGTTMENYRSYGSFQLQSWESGVSLCLMRNPSGIGFQDSAITHLQYLYTDSYEERKRLFLAGKLDRLTLSATDARQYQGSAKQTAQPTSTVLRFVFAADPAALSRLEETESENKTVLSYGSFRQAIACLLDRTALCEYMPGYIPCDRLFSPVYKTVFSNSSSDPTDTFAEARACFAQAYREAIEDGVYCDGQTIRIRCAVSSVQISENDTKQEALLNQWLQQATKHTGFENNVSLEFCVWQGDRYTAVANGEIEMIRGGWIGSADDPIGLIRSYTDPDYVGGLEYIPESCGWNPKNELLTLPMTDGTHTASLTEWAQRLSVSGDVSAVSHDTVMVLQALENAVLASYQCIPIAVEAEYTLYSHRISFSDAGETLTFLYSDAQWESYVTAHTKDLYS